jgi:hypothetical protein
MYVNNLERASVEELAYPALFARTLVQFGNLEK